MPERSFSTPIFTAVWAKAGVATSIAAIEASSNLPFCIFCFLPCAAPRARFVCLNAEISMQLHGVRFDFVVRDGVDNQIGRASCRERVCLTGRFRWLPSH